MLLQRSGRVPLTLIYPTHKTSPLSKETLQVVLSVFHRIQELRSVLDQQFVKLSEYDCGSLDAPFLDKLSVVASVPGDRTSFPTITNASWPRLKILDCTDISMHLLQALLRPSLTSLTVLRHPVPQPAVMWVSLLKELPCLEHLNLTGVVAEPGVPVNVIPRPTRMVTLLNLREPYLGDPGVGTACADFLNHLIIPIAAQRSFRTFSRSNEEELRFILSACAAKASGDGVIGEPKPIRTLAFDDPWIHSAPLAVVSISIYTENVSIDDAVRDSRDLPSIEEFGWSEFISIANAQHIVLPTFASVYSLQNMLGIRGDAADIVNAKAWKAFSNQPSLREICIGHSNPSATRFIELLSQAVSFPKLETVIFNYTLWNKRHKNRGKRRARKASVLPPLVRALEIRRERGQELKQLDLVCGVNLERRDHCSHDLECLGEIVENFDYDCEEVDECDTCHEDEGQSSEDDGSVSGEEEGGN